MINLCGSEQCGGGPGSPLSDWIRRDILASNNQVPGYTHGDSAIRGWGLEGCINSVRNGSFDCRAVRGWSACPVLCSAAGQAHSQKPPPVMLKVNFIPSVYWKEVLLTYNFIIFCYIKWKRHAHTGSDARVNFDTHHRRGSIGRQICWVLLLGMGVWRFLRHRGRKM